MKVEIRKMILTVQGMKVYFMRQISFCETDDKTN